MERPLNKIKLMITLNQFNLKKILVSIFQIMICGDKYSSSSSDSFLLKYFTTETT